MLLYLAGSTRPDIAYNVHQDAMFSHKPRLSHTIALKHIARYLKGTRAMGIIMQPGISQLHFNIYVNADIAGLFASEDKYHPISVKTRTSLLFIFWNVPIFWSSKLQPENSLSTLEADYITMS